MLFVKLPVGGNDILYVVADKVTHIEATPEHTRVYVVDHKIERSIDLPADKLVERLKGVLPAMRILDLTKDAMKD